MGGMACETIFGRWFVLPEKRATFVSVTIVAKLVDRQARQCALRCAAMCGVAIGAGHFFFRQRVAVGLVEFRAHVLVAGTTHLKLPGALQDIVRPVDPVAVCAGDIRLLVGATLPMTALVVAVARQSGFVLL